MPTTSDMTLRGTNDETETTPFLGAPPSKRSEKVGAIRASACLIALLLAAGLSTAVLYFTGLTQCWMLLGGADPAAWWNDAVENQDLGPGPEPRDTNCTVCFSAAPPVFRGCPFDEIGFYLLAGFAAAVPNFILCAVLVALCAARGRIAEAGRRPLRQIWRGPPPPGNMQ